MAFPNTPLDIRTDLLIDGVWTQIPTYERDTVVIDSGRSDLAAQTEPGSLQVTINNRDNQYSPRNPLSPLYGKIGRNTRIRLSVPGTVSYLELDGNPANYASTPDTAALDIAGDLDVRWEGETNWYQPDAQMLIGKWGLPGNRSWSMRLQGAWLYFLVSADGTTTRFMNWPLPPLPRHAALRATIDVNNGAGGVTFRMYWAETLAGPWTQFSDDVIGTGTTTIFNSTAPLTIAPNQPDTGAVRLPVAGKVYKAEVRSGIDGTAVAAPDF
ncbi:MAG TPA: hypothetical protein VFX74_00890, partial [Candidatus Limnocylindria bacterium]|nr:hypothetical protein [Candidatus Limnocylindria bacterium]